MNCALSNANPGSDFDRRQRNGDHHAPPRQQRPLALTRVQVTGTNSAQSKTASFTVNLKDSHSALGTGAITIPQPPPGNPILFFPVTPAMHRKLQHFDCAFLCRSACGSHVRVCSGFADSYHRGHHLHAHTHRREHCLGRARQHYCKRTAGTLIRQQAIAVTLPGPKLHSSRHSRYAKCDQWELHHLHRDVHSFRRYDGSDHWSVAARCLLESLAPRIRRKSLPSTDAQ